MDGSLSIRQYDQTVGRFHGKEQRNCLQSYFRLRNGSRGCGDDFVRRAGDGADGTRGSGGRGTRSFAVAGWADRRPCRTGNNGGDGWIAAGFFATRGTASRSQWPATAQASRATRRSRQAALVASAAAATTEVFAGAGLVIDALYGAGLRLPMPREAAALVEAVNASDATAIVAVDLRAASRAPAGPSANRCDGRCDGHVLPAEAGPFPSAGPPPLRGGPPGADRHSVRRPACHFAEDVPQSSRRLAEQPAIAIRRRTQIRPWPCPRAFRIGYRYRRGAARGPRGAAGRSRAGIVGPRRRMLSQSTRRI